MNEGKPLVVYLLQAIGQSSLYASPRGCRCSKPYSKTEAFISSRSTDVGLHPPEKPKYIRKQDSVSGDHEEPPQNPAGPRRKSAEFKCQILVNSMAEILKGTAVRFLLNAGAKISYSYMFPRKGRKRPKS
jgi:hypothetical protein